MTIDELEAAGFRENTPYHGSPHDREWWKTVRGPGGEGKKFPLQVRLWRFSKYSTPDRPAEDGWDAKAYFEGFSGAEGHGFWVERSCRDETPDQVVAWFHNVWRRLGCQWNGPPENPNEEAA